jgi:peptidoglycan/LPS O-acetylase OafA/YrhL
MAGNERLHYVDWLRTGAFAVLIVYHSSVAFFPGMDWLISGAERSAALQMVMDHPRAWRLALLFFVSGMGLHFALRARPAAAFLGDRVNRLLPPLLFAMAVVVVPQVWYERVWAEGYDGSLATFWLTRYFTEGKYPEGNVTWAHMWFVAYLLAMTVVCVPLFRTLEMRWARPLNDWFVRVASSSGVYALFLLPLALNLALSPFFPRQTNALYNDGAWFAVWASWFGLGYLFARHHAAIVAALVARRRVSAVIALLISGILYETAWTADGHGLIGGWNDMTPLFKAAVMGLAWAMILTLVGYAALYLNCRSRVLAWLSPKVFPLYIVHQTVIVGALFHVLPLDLPLAAKWLLVVAATVVLSLAAATAAERLPWPLRALMGLADDGRRSKVAADQPAR